MQFQRGLDGIFSAIVNLGLITPGQKLRIGLHVVDQDKHFPCRVRNYRASVYLSHIAGRLTQDAYSLQEYHNNRRWRHKSRQETPQFE